MNYESETRTTWKKMAGTVSNEWGQRSPGYEVGYPGRELEKSWKMKPNLFLQVRGRQNPESTRPEESSN